MKRYDIVFSLGEDCAYASYMKLAHIRRVSGPFDWLTHASFEERFRLLTNNFSDFLNKDDFCFLQKDPNMFNDESCDYYENRRTQFYFYHDFMINVPFEQSFNTVKEKYRRRIERFYNLIMKNKNVLFIWFSHDTNTDNAVIKSLCNDFCDKMNKVFDFLIIENDCVLGCPVKTIISENIIKYNLCTMKHGDNPTMGNVSEVLPLFKEVCLRKRYVFIRKALEITSKIVCPFIFYKPIRKKVKKILRKY